tara:strand:- start:48 stop:338 length:291 start_codon:yes stop_codon:yes gene_type:complete
MWSCWKYDKKNPDISKKPPVYWQATSSCSLMLAKEEVGFLFFGGGRNRRTKSASLNAGPHGPFLTKYLLDRGSNLGSQYGCDTAWYQQWAVACRAC